MGRPDQRDKTLMDNVRSHIATMQEQGHALLRERSGQLGSVKLFITPIVLIVGLVFAPPMIFYMRRMFLQAHISYRGGWDEADREREHLRMIIAALAML